MNLREEPWKYPGTPLSEAVLLGVSGSAPGEWVRILAREERRLGQACVRMPEGDLPLNYVLLTHNAAAVDVRRPVAAFGSNADPAVLLNKFQEAAVNPITPLRVGSLANARLMTSAHVSRPGYLPAGAEYAPGASLPVVVAWLDGPQLDCLDRTEPNYNRVVLDPGHHPIVLDDNGEELPGAALYDTKWGVLPGEPLRDQLELWQALLRRRPDIAALLQVPADADAEARKDLMRRLGKDPGLRDTVRDLLRADARPGGLVGETGGIPPTYGSAVSRWHGGSTRQGGPLQVRPTPDDTQRRGEVVVVLHPDTAKAAVGAADHAVVSPVVTPAAGDDLAVLVAVHRDRNFDPGGMGADQVVRNALGLELTESARLRPANVRRKRLADAVLGVPTYVTCRVQPADLTTVERQVCLVDTLSLSLLGIGSGDEVVVQGFPSGSGEQVVATRKLRAHEAPDTVLGRRSSLSGGTFESRFPSSRDALGVYPDLPWIFLDSATRTALHVKGKLGTVRIRASRRYQLLRDLRESFLLALLALVGLAQVIPSPAVLVGLTLAVLVLSAVAVVLRLRNRLVSSDSG